jgi:nucleotide-binding universal stress UspA family protein
MIRKILVPLDGSHPAESALPQAAAMAKAFGAEVLVLHIQETPGRQGSAELVDSVAWRLARAEVKSYIEERAEILRSQGVQASALLAQGEPADSILHQVRVQRADLVVLASHGHGRPETFKLGSTAQQVLSRGGTSVLIVRAGEAPAEVRFQRVMVPLDGSQRAQWALLQAASLVRGRGGEILLVHVVAPPRLAGPTPPSQEETDLAHKIAARDRRLAERYLSDAQELMAGSGVTARSLLIESPHVVRTLDKVAVDEQVSLTVISAHGCSGAAPWPYGSVADRLIHHGTVPLLVLQDLSPREPETAESGVSATRT